MGCETQTQETDTYSCLKIESNYRVKRMEKDEEKKRERERDKEGVCVHSETRGKCDGESARKRVRCQKRGGARWGCK